MCTYLMDLKQEDKSKSIKAYKVFSRDADGNLRSPYYASSCFEETNKVYTAQDSSDSDIMYFDGHKAHVDMGIDGVYRLRGGFFHSFVNYVDAVHFSKESPFYTVRTVIIPKESKAIFRGIDAVKGVPVYASSEILIK